MKYITDDGDTITDESVMISSMLCISIRIVGLIKIGVSGQFHELKHGCFASYRTRVSMEWIVRDSVVLNLSWQTVIVAPRITAILCNEWNNRIVRRKYARRNKDIIIINIIQKKSTAGHEFNFVERM